MKSIRNFQSRLLVIISILLSSLACNSQNIPNLSDLNKKCDPAIVRIYTIGPDGQYDSQASGCIISADGIGITNFHVLAGTKKAIAIFPSGEKQEITSILDYNETSDLIKFRIGNATTTSYLVLSNDSLDKGESVFTIGYPNGFLLEGESTLSTGIISGFRVIEGIRNIQTTAPITHGSSGGGLFDSKGLLCGITSGTFAEYYKDLHANLNKVVPASEIKKLNRNLSLSLSQFFNEISKTNILAKAVLYFEKGDFEQALPLFQEHLKAIPSDASAWFKAGMCAYVLYLRNPELTEYKDFAIQSYEYAAFLDQTNYYAIGQLSLMYFVLGMNEEGKEYASKCFKMAPNEWFSCIVMGHSYTVDERYEDALALYNKGIEICNSANITTVNGILFIDKIYSSRGAIKQKLNLHKEALDDYNKALSYSPDDLNLLWAKFICCYVNLKYTTVSCETITKIYKLSPNSSFGNFSVTQWKDAACGTVTITGPYITFQSEEGYYLVANNGVTLGEFSPGKPLVLNNNVKANITYYFDIYKVNKYGNPVFLVTAPIVVINKHVEVNINKNSKVSWTHY